MTSVPASKQQASADPTPPTVVVSGDGDRLALAGALEIATLPAARNSLKQWSKQGPSRSLDVSRLDSLDTPGTTGGVAVNIGTFISPLMIQTFAAAGVGFHNDAILSVALGVGQQSVQNNFSEVQVVSSIVPPPPETPPPPPPIHIPA